MTCKYTLKNGETIIMDIFERFLEPGKKVVYHPASDMNSYLPKNIIEVLMDEETNKPYFIIGDEQRYFSDYDYLSLNEFIEKIHKGASSGRGLTYEDFIATLFKEKDNIGFVLLNYEENGIIRVFCPIGTEIIPETNWENKIFLKAGGIEEELYTRELFKLICVGDVKVVNRGEPIKVNQTEVFIRRILSYIKRPR